jgi:chromosome segregation ATPase
MGRKIWSMTLMVLSTIVLVASLIGVGAAWYYNTPLTEEILSRLAEIDSELTQAKSSLTDAQGELERALRIVTAAETALEALSKQTAQAQDILGGVKGTIDEKLLPGLKTSREKVDGVKGMVEDLRGTLETINNLPLVDLNLPGDELLANIIAAADSLDAEIANVEDIAKQASTFVGDTSYLLGGDLSETKTSLTNLLAVIKEYNGKVTGWQEQITAWEQSLPGWIDKTSISLTVFLLWFAFSQAGLFLIGLTAWKGGDPFAVLRKSG